MHIVLTDVLTCPRCGPDFGLVLLADRVEARRVAAGALGCSNCREQYPVRAGVTYFDGSVPSDRRAAEAPRIEAGDSATAPNQSPAAERDAAVMRLGAVLGVTHGPGFVLLAGQVVAHAAALAALIEDIEVVAVHIGRAPAGSRVGDGVSHIVLTEAGAKLPLATGKLAGIALSGAAADVLLEDSMRALSPVARLVLEQPPADTDARLAAHRLRVLLRDAATVVAARY